MSRLGQLQSGDPLLNRTQLRFFSHGVCLSLFLWLTSTGEEEEEQIKAVATVTQTRWWLGGGRWRSLVGADKQQNCHEMGRGATRSNK